jgi:hypothetical protein
MEAIIGGGIEMAQRKILLKRLATSLKVSIKVLTELTKLLKHQDRLIAIAAYILPEEWLGDWQESLGELSGWTKTISSIGKLCLLGVAYMQIKFQDVASPGDILVLVEESAERTLWTLRSSLIAKERLRNQLFALNSVLAAKDVSNFGDGELAMAKKIVDLGYADSQKSLRSISTAHRDLKELIHHLQPLVRFTHAELQDISRSVDGFRDSAVEEQLKHHRLSGEITDIIHEVQNRWPGLDDLLAGKK